jgi:competence ComEA-like helix-hairpin-helix protein
MLKNAGLVASGASIGMRALLSLVLCAAAFGQQKAPDDADGKKTFENVCSQCHELSLSTGRRSTHDEWMAVVQRMAEKGANASDAEYFAIVDYLTKNYGPARLNVNQATAVDLAPFFAITEADAEGIVKYRKANGNFKSLDDLLKSGADRKKIEAKKDSIEF